MLPDLQREGPTIEVVTSISAAEELALKQPGLTIPKPVEMRVMVDPGAIFTVIDPEIATKLNLTAVGQEEISTATSKGVKCPKYAVRIAFPRGKWQGTVIAAPILANFQIDGLIGRDVLANAVFVYNGGANFFSLSL